MLHNPVILLSLSGLVVSQPLSQSVGRGFESQRMCWDFSSLKNRAISALIYIFIYIYIHIYIYISMCVICINIYNLLATSLTNIILYYDILDTTTYKILQNNITLYTIYIIYLHSYILICVYNRNGTIVLFCRYR